jgi:2'-5' RNA ligase
LSNINLKPVDIPHLTLLFIGPKQENNLRKIIDAATNVFCNPQMPAFTIIIKNELSGPPIPTLALKVSEEILSPIFAKLKSELEFVGIKFGRASFNGHISLSASDKVTPEIRQTALKNIQQKGISNEVFMVDEIELVETYRSNNILQHNILKVFKLRK